MKCVLCIYNNKTLFIAVVHIQIHDHTHTHTHRKHSLPTDLADLWCQLSLHLNQKKRNITFSSSVSPDSFSSFLWHHIGTYLCFRCVQGSNHHFLLPGTMCQIGVIPVTSSAESFPSVIHVKVWHHQCVYWNHNWVRICHGFHLKDCD